MPLDRESETAIFSAQQLDLGPVSTPQRLPRTREFKNSSSGLEAINPGLHKAARVGQHGTTRAHRNSLLQRAQEVDEIPLLGVGELEAENVLVALDHVSQRGCGTIMEIVGARRQIAQARQGS